MSSKHKVEIGIYQIRNILNEHVYIGSSVNIKNRWKDHKNKLRNRKHCNSYLQNAWNKHGRDNFAFEIIEVCLKEVLIAREQYYLDARLPAYNIQKIAAQPPHNTPSEEVTTARRIKMAEMQAAGVMRGAKAVNRVNFRNW